VPGYAPALLVQRVAQQEERQEGAQAAKDEQVLLPSGHGVGAKAIPLPQPRSNTPAQQRVTT
jgi:hypothetical protein